MSTSSPEGYAVRRPKEQNELEYIRRGYLTEEFKELSRGIDDQCPRCEKGTMKPEHSHRRCNECGYRDNCCGD